MSISEGNAIEDTPARARKNVIQVLLAPVVAAHRETGGAGFDARVPAALLTCALSVTLINYYGQASQFAAWFPSLCEGEWADLPARLWWLAVRIVGYALLPLVVARAAGVGAGDLGLRAAGLRRQLWIFAAMYATVLPLVVLASYGRGFQRTYPLYKLAGADAAHLAAWWLIYATSLFTIELFYRGFLIGMLRRSLGAYGIFVSVIPYVMIHSHKPLSESVGSIITGTLFGALALGYRSIWVGVFTHVSVALTMDALALLHQGAWRL
jgi:hypothetical protein